MLVTVNIIQCINKISKNVHEIENLMKNQISVTPSVVNFNNTIRKIPINEETFNKDLVAVEVNKVPVKFFGYL